MQKTLFYIVFLLNGLVAFSQNEQLANYNFDKGEFEKALIGYEELLINQKGNSQFFIRTIECYQQLEQYQKAEKALEERLNTYKFANLYVELGYNYQLQKNQVKANLNYNLALDKIKENISNVYAIASTFEKKVLLEYALKAYQLAESLDSKVRFNYQTALLYGQLGKIDLMIEKYLEEIYAVPQNTALIQNHLSRFMEDDTGLDFNLALKKALLIRAQKNQDIFWNQMLSWFFVQQKEYGKAFTQEKAIYKREQESFNNIVNLAELAIEEKEEEIAKEILTFVLENTNELELKIYANHFLMKMKVASAVEKEYITIKSEFQTLLNHFEITPYSLSLQIQLAKLETFKLNNPEAGKTILQNALNLPLNKYQIAETKLELADVFLYQEKFNQALLFYTQIEEDLKNDVIGHEASLKAAKTSYFKSDFEWALTQLKVLKSSSTQLIANDALELFLLINDNTFSDSTQTALKKFAKGDFLLYQNKNNEALSVFLSILKDHKLEDIVDETLYRIATTYKELNQFDLALNYFNQIIENHKESIYRDEAIYFLAEIYNKNLLLPEKAKTLYEMILFNHQDSIYFIESRKKFRQLRGDTNL